MKERSYKRYLLVLLTGLLAFNYVDRVVLSVVLEPLKSDLSLSDTQLGVLTGVAFALFYSIMGIPIARWADRGNRVSIIALTAALWSIAVALCGVARSFSQLLFMRMVVPVGEAGCIPPGHSLIADEFAREERPRAVALYAQGGTVAMTLGYFAAGWLGERVGWRLTFIFVGAPGLLLALLAWATLTEPRRAKGTALSQSVCNIVATQYKEIPPSVVVASQLLWRNVTFRHLLLSFSVTYFFGYGIIQWQPTFFIRSHGLTTAHVGGWFALVYGVVGGIGTFLGGELASRYAPGDERRQMDICAATSVVCAVLTAGSFLVRDTGSALTLLAAANLFGYASMGPVLAAIQTLVAPRMRAVSIALVYLCANLVGMGLGPVAAGAMSDALTPLFGVESLRYALLLLCPGYIWGAWHLWRAGQTVRGDVLQATVEHAAVRQSQSSNSLSELGTVK